MPFKIVRKDITEMHVDAIVNAARPRPIYADGTGRAADQAAGVQGLPAGRQKIGNLAVGQAAATLAFGLAANYIIHTVEPVWQGGGHGEEDLLKSCYENSLFLALSRRCASIAFPLIAVGAHGFPKGRALTAALAVIRKFLAQHEMMVYLVVLDDEPFHLSGTLFADVGAFIGRHYVGEKASQEYLYGNARPSGQELEEASMALPMLAAKIAPNPPEPRKEEAPAAGGIAPAQKEEVEARKMLEFPQRAPKEPPAPAARERSLAEVMEEVGETFQERLLRLIDERGMTNAEVYKKANLDRKLFSKILCNPAYHPRKHTVLAFAIALELNLDETKDLLARAEYALSPSSKFDLAVEYFIVHGVYDVFTINTALFDYGQPMLGG